MFQLCQIKIIFILLILILCVCCTTIIELIGPFCGLTYWYQAGLRSRGVPALSVNPSGDLFAGTVNISTYIEIYRSTDDGDSWKGETIWAIAESLKGYIFIGTRTSGVMRMEGEKLMDVLTG